jgi:ribonucleotide monophosphatase NagD (HAD superfamily)
MSFWDRLDPRYRVILCDVWGVIHDGVRLYPGAADRLRQWRSQERKVILITNAPRTADAVEAQLRRLGLSDDHWDGISTSGEAGIAAISQLGRAAGFLGTREDRFDLESRGLRFVDAGFGDIAVTGLDDEQDRVLFHCFNPDRVVIQDGAPELCAGALADAYAALGGPVAWYGKPYPAIYRHALSLAGDPPKEAVLAVGDSLVTDMLGAAREGYDAVFVQGGIHAGEDFPAGFATEFGLAPWVPVAVVDAL